MIAKTAKIIPSPNQHLRLKLDQVKSHYQGGLITSSGLLYYSIGIMRPPGKGLKLRPKEWMELTGLKRSTFFHAKAKLVAQGWLKEDVADSVEIELVYASKILDGNFQVVEKSDSPPLKKDAELFKNDEKHYKSRESNILDPESNILDPESNILDPESNILDPESNILDNRGLQPLACIVSSISPDITNKSNTPNLRGENFKNLEEVEEEKYRATMDNSTTATSTTATSTMDNSTTATSTTATSTTDISTMDTSTMDTSTGQKLPSGIIAQLAKLKILGSGKDAQVMEVCTSGRYNLAQIKKAIYHVSGTWYNCKNHAAIFLHQLPKQSADEAKAISDRDKLRAPEFVPGLISLKELRGRYPSYWEEPARYYGYSEEAIEQFKATL